MGEIKENAMGFCLTVFLLLLLLIYLPPIFFHHSIHLHYSPATCWPPPPKAASSSPASNTYMMDTEGDAENETDGLREIIGRVLGLFLGLLSKVKGMDYFHEKCEERIGAYQQEWGKMNFEW